jgi:hypothetical protein
MCLDFPFTRHSTRTAPSPSVLSRPGSRAIIAAGLRTIFRHSHVVFSHRCTNYSRSIIELPTRQLHHNRDTTWARSSSKLRSPSSTSTTLHHSTCVTIANPPRQQRTMANPHLQPRRRDRSPQNRVRPRKRLAQAHKQTLKAVEAQIQFNKSRFNTINSQQHQIRTAVETHFQEIERVKVDFNNWVKVKNLALGKRWSVLRKKCD